MGGVALGLKLFGVIEVTPDPKPPLEALRTQELGHTAQGSDQPMFAVSKCD